METSVFVPTSILANALSIGHKANSSHRSPPTPVGGRTEYEADGAENG